MGHEAAAKEVHSTCLQPQACEHCEASIRVVIAEDPRLQKFLVTLQQSNTQHLGLAEGKQRAQDNPTVAYTAP